MALSADQHQMVQRAVQSLTTATHAETNPLAGAGMAHDALQVWLDAAHDLTLLRTAMIRRAVQDRYTTVDIASALSLSRQRVQQLAEMPPGVPGRRPVSEDRSMEVATILAQRSGIQLLMDGRADYHPEAIILTLTDGAKVRWERMDQGPLVIPDGESFRARMTFDPKG